MRETHARLFSAFGLRIGIASVRRISQTSGAQLLDDPARQGFDIASRVLLDRCDNDALDLGRDLLSVALAVLTAPERVINRSQQIGHAEGF